MSKLKVFLWQVCHGSLPTRGNLLARGLNIDPLCPHCSGAIEDAEHLFTGCPHAQTIWQLACDHGWITVDMPVSSQLNLEDWLSRLKRLRPNVKMDRVVALLWSIWKTRNGKVFRNEPSSPGLSLLCAKRVSAEWRIRHKLLQTLQPIKRLHSTRRYK